MARTPDWREDRWSDPDPRADNFVWALVFIGIGLMILLARSPESPGWFLLLGGVSAGVGLSRLFKAMFE